MILHVEKEKDVQLEKLVKENELIANQLETVETVESAITINLKLCL